MAECPAFNPDWIPDGLEDRDEILKTVFSQMMSASKGELVKCTTCGNHYRPWVMYRCYYCGRYYCEVCSPKHFGKTRQEACDALQAKRGEHG